MKRVRSELNRGPFAEIQDCVTENIAVLRLLLTCQQCLRAEYAYLLCDELFTRFNGGDGSPAASARVGIPNTISGY